MSPEHMKAAADSVVMPTAVLAWLKAITVPDIAALLAAPYTLLRIIELCVKWTRRKK